VYSGTFTAAVYLIHFCQSLFMEEKLYVFFLIFIEIVTHGMAFHYSAYSSLMCLHPRVFLVSLICELHIFVWCAVYLTFVSVLSGFRIQLSLYATRLFSVV
jgi:hypothetical protein